MIEINQKAQNTELLKQIILDSYTGNRFCRKNFPSIYTRTENADLLLELIPEFNICVGFSQNNIYHRHDVYEHNLFVCWYVNKNDFILKLAGLLHDIGKPDCCVYDETTGNNRFHGHPEVSYNIVKDKILPRFNLTNQEQDKLLFLIRYHDISLTYKTMRRFYLTYGEEYLRDLFILKQADYDDHVFPDGFENTHWAVSYQDMNNMLDEVITNETRFKIKDLEISGKDIMELYNLPESKNIGIILNHIFTQVCDKTLENQRDLLINYLKLNKYPLMLLGYESIDFDKSSLIVPN